METTAPAGYLASNENKTFIIDGSNLSKSYVGTDAITNDRIQGDVELVKQNSMTNAPMADVEFTLWNADGTKVGV